MSKVAVFEQSFSEPDNLWNIVKISQSGQSVGGQTEGNDCNSLTVNRAIIYGP